MELVVTVQTVTNTVKSGIRKQISIAKGDFAWIFVSNNEEI